MAIPTRPKAPEPPRTTAPLGTPQRRAEGNRAAQVALDSLAVNDDKRAELGRLVLGERIRRLRMTNGQTSGLEFAKLVGISPTYLSDVEHGRRLPNLEILDRIAQALATNVQALLVSPPWGPGKMPTKVPTVRDARRRATPGS